MLSEILIKTIGLFYFIFLARNLSVEMFGRYNLITSFVTIFSFLPDIGIGLIVVREIAKKTQNRALLLGNAFILGCIMSAIAIVAVITSGFFLKFPSEVMLLLFISALTLLFSQIRSVPLFYFDGIERMGYSAGLKTLNSLLFMFFGFLGYILGFGLLGIVTGFLIGSIISLFVTWVVFVFKKIKINLTIDKKVATHLILSGLPLGIAAFSSLIYGNIDAIMLERMLSEKALGIYSSTTKFGPTLLQLLNVPFVVAVYPALARLSAEDTKRFKKAIIKSTGVVLCWSIPASIGISLFANIIPEIFGDRYSEGVFILRFLIFFVPFAALSAILYKVLIVIKKQYLYLAISVFGVILNVILNLIFIPRFQIIGAATSAVITQIGLSVVYSAAVYWLVFKKK